MAKNPTCHAHRTNGLPCTLPAMHGQLVCFKHGGASPQAKNKAMERIIAAADPAAAELVKLATGKNVLISDAVRLQAIRDLLDRAGLAVKTQVELSGSTGIVIQYLSDDPIPSPAGRPSDS